MIINSSTMRTSLITKVSAIIPLLLCLLHGSETARILVILPMPLWSHYMQFENLFEALAVRGHQLMVYSPFPPKTELKNFQHIKVNLAQSKEFFDKLNHFELKESGTYGAHSFKGHLESTLLAFSYGLGMTNEIFNQSAIQSLMASDQKFDLVIGEFWFSQETLAVFGHKFRAPLIAEMSYGTPHNAYQFMGNPNLYSYMPDYKFAFPSRMNFLQRVQNTILGVFTHLAGDFWYYPAQDRLMRDFAGNPANLPYIKTLLKNVSATFIYSDVLFEFPRPQVSNMIHVGGIHLKTGKLPKDLEDIMNASPKGVIYVSFGSLIKPSKMSPHMRDLLIRALSSTGLTVVWRWEGEAIENLPKNVHLRSWVPQQDILAHPNCRLFVSHGGVNSVLETVHYAVPMVGIAFYNDQYSNVKHVIDLGAGVELSYFNITEESLTWATRTVLNNPGYKLAAVKASRRFNDRQTSPLHSAVWWVEYVLRHHGAPHLRTGFDDLSWLEFLLLDVLAFLLVILLTVLYVLLRILRAFKFCVLYPFAGKEKAESKKKNKKE